MLVDWCPACLREVEASDGACEGCSSPVVAARWPEVKKPPRRPKRGWSSYPVPARFRRPGNVLAYEAPRLEGRVILKVCNGCKEEKEHRPRADYPGQARALCVDCTREYQRAYRREHWIQRKLRDTWKGMINRCHNPRAMRRWSFASMVPNVRDYADAGVTVCARWRDPKHGLDNFIFDMGPPPTPLHTLDRKNPRRNYTPSNCRWADKFTQDANRKNTRWIEAPDPATGTLLRLSLAEWARRSGTGGRGLTRHAIARRLARGWDPVRAVLTPNMMTKTEPSGLSPVPF